MRKIRKGDNLKICREKEDETFNNPIFTQYVQDFYNFKY